MYLCITLARLQIKSWVKGDSKEVGVLQRLLSGSAAGAISQTTIYPMEVSSCMSCYKYNSVSSSRLRHACPACPSGLVTLVLCRPLSLVLSCHACPACPSGLVTLVLCRPLSLVLSCHACPACPSGLVTLVLCRPLSLVLSCMPSLSFRPCHISLVQATLAGLVLSCSLCHACPACPSVVSH